MLNSKFIGIMKTSTINRNENGTMTTESKNAVCAELFKNYASNTALKAAMNEVCEGYGLSAKEWKEVISEVKRLRGEALKDDLKAAKTSAFEFSKWLAAGFDLLRKDAAFCRIYARWQSSKLKGEDLNAFVSSWYPFVEWNADRTAFELLKPAYLYRLDASEVESLTTEHRVQIFTAWEKTAEDAAKVLLKSFEAWAKSYGAYVLGNTLTHCNSREQNRVYRVEEWDAAAGKWIQHPERCDTFTDALDTFRPFKYFRDSDIILPHTIKPEEGGAANA